MSEMISTDELLFFDMKPASIPLYDTFREFVLSQWPDTRIEVKKTQVSFFNRHMFAAVSFAPVRRAKERPEPFLTISFGLPYMKKSVRIDAATDPYPNRWTHHVMIGTSAEVDDELKSWITEAVDFADRK